MGLACWRCRCSPEAAYAIGEARKWPVGLARQPLQAKAFYATIALAVALGIGMNFAAINPINALYWSAVLNGVVAVPVMALMMVVSSNKRIMGKFTIGPVMRIVGWLATGVMSAAVLAMAVAAVG